MLSSLGWGTPMPTFTFRMHSKSSISDRRRPCSVRSTRPVVFAKTCTCLCACSFEYTISSVKYRQEHAKLVYFNPKYLANVTLFTARQRRGGSLSHERNNDLRVPNGQ
ncbi:hypothetical protein EVAR_29824_1 [Eumeta japonica]|uniref:Uncharacterized protein n=1 Tax=Eumeta variegata TaxID=151549 RepID=A0A4C1VWL6_EUMVA|nr:hypothetical protein EVAR_29824_1 [Eumeta japonica]